MNYVKMMALSLSLLVVPATSFAAAPTWADTLYINKAKELAADNVKAAIGLGVAAGAAVGYYAHTKNILGFRTYVSNPAIGYAKAYLKNLKAGEPKTVVATIAALVIGGYLIKQHCFTTPEVIVAGLDAETLTLLANSRTAQDVDDVIADIRAKDREAEDALKKAVTAAETLVAEAQAKTGADKVSDAEIKRLQEAVTAAEKARDDADARKARREARDAEVANLEALAADLKKGLDDEATKARHQNIRKAANELAARKAAELAAKTKKK